LYAKGVPGSVRVPDFLTRPFPFCPTPRIMAGMKGTLITTINVLLRQE
jgi:hypothetical protein